MRKQLHSATLEQDEGIRPEDLFRRAAFGWVQSTKKLIESSALIGPNTQVAHAALADIELGKELLDKFFIPPKLKGVPSAGKDEFSSVEEIRDTIADAAAHLVSVSKFRHPVADLSAPVWPKNGKMLWAGTDCPVCPSVAGERCQKDETAFGKYIEKPHPQRKAQAAREVVEVVVAEEIQRFYGGQQAPLPGGVITITDSV